VFIYFQTWKTPILEGKIFWLQPYSLAPTVSEPYSKPVQSIALLCRHPYSVRRDRISILDLQTDCPEAVIVFRRFMEADDLKRSTIPSFQILPDSSLTIIVTTGIIAYEIAC
jgi:hypothetical protein